MCGEKIDKIMPKIEALGSPPHVRGKVYYPSESNPEKRITPACAGKRERKAASLPVNSDHPRMCGEKAEAVKAAPWVLGSPPHVRGKVPLAGAALSMGWITPACAGKSVHRSGLHRTEGDHPRMCGEKRVCRVRGRQLPGSPPHVRGKDFCFCLSFSFCRITPACAGKSTPSMMVCSRFWDHPRMCGEKTKKIP
mgnify:CR=1 FL=1